MSGTELGAAVMRAGSRAEMHTEPEHALRALSVFRKAMDGTPAVCQAQS